MDTNKVICFDKNNFNLYLFVLIVFVIYLFYIIHIRINKPILYTTVISKGYTNENTNQNTRINQDTTIPYVQNKFLDKLYNPLSPPENLIPSGTFTTPPYNPYMQYQNLGYLTGNGTQYNVFGRWMYPNKSDRWQYYIINNDRSKIKIPFKTKNNQELYDGDQVDIMELGTGFIFKKYENEGLRYDPNIF